MDRKISIKSLSDLKEAEYNPRNISREALTGLKYSLEEFGDLSGITFNLKTGNLVAGHQRVNALKEKYGDLDISSGKIITPDGNEFKVRFVEWDIQKEKAANIAANNPLLQGEFEEQGLKLMVEEINLSLPDLSEQLRFNDIPELSVPTFDVLRDLEQNEFVNLVSCTSSEFQITFNFPKEYQEQFKTFMKEKGKDFLVETILEIIQKG